MPTIRSITSGQLTIRTSNRHADCCAVRIKRAICRSKECAEFAHTGVVRACINTLLAVSNRTRAAIQPGSR